MYGVSTESQNEQWFNISKPFPKVLDIKNLFLNGIDPSSYIKSTKETYAESIWNEIQDKKQRVNENPSDIPGDNRDQTKMDTNDYTEDLVTKLPIPPPFGFMEPEPKLGIRRRLLKFLNH